jgi:hypothetical protein
MKDQDILLIADYGRSAQGWLSYMLCYILNARYIEPYNLLTGKNYTNSETIKKNTKGRLSGRAETKFSFVVKTHDLPSKSDFKLTESIIYLTRDPRDVSISYYYLALSWRKAGSRSLGSLLHILPIVRHLYVGWRWGFHFRGWERIHKLHVRYEDLRADTEGQLISILRHFNVEVDVSLVREAVEIFSFENTYGRKRGQEDRENVEARKGQIGDYRNHIGAYMNKLFWCVCGEEAEKAGYFLDGSTTKEPTSNENRKNIG